MPGGRFNKKCYLVNLLTILSASDTWNYVALNISTKHPSTQYRLCLSYYAEASGTEQNLSNTETIIISEVSFRGRMILCTCIKLGLSQVRLS